MLAGAGAAGLGAPRAAAEPIPMRVVIYDYADVPEAALDAGRRTVDQIFRKIGVEITWMDPAQFQQAMPDDIVLRRAFVGAVLQISIVSPAMERKLGMHEHTAGTASTGTRLAWVSLAQLKRFGEQADLGTVLGYVIAHEIGHLLLPAKSHAVRGLMQERVDPRLIAHNNMWFLPEHATIIRCELAGRNQRLQVAHARDAPSADLQPMQPAGSAPCLGRAGNHRRTDSRLKEPSQ